jgi:type VI secretion system secreted protein VgrG
MRAVKQGPATLAITDSQTNLHVISFTGREALNQLYRFDIDVISAALDVSNLLQRSAFFTFGASGEGVHGTVREILTLHSGARMSLYRMSLLPDLERLATASSTRTFNGMSVPQIIIHLLSAHGIGADRFRFDATTGIFPPREHCVQYAETDLHLLQRLCEEEGISFRFEHQHEGHSLVFADDPASFPERAAALHLQPTDTAGTPGLTHFAEQLTISPSYSSHQCANLPAEEEQVDHRDPAATLRPDTHGMGARQRQVSARTLERLRCERRVIKGRSDQPGLVSGHIVRTAGHVDRLMNDQWLLTDIHHQGSEMGSPAGVAVHGDGSIAPPARHSPAWQYRNAFSVIPWAMPFRPPLAHRKPTVTEVHAASLSRPALPDASGRLRVRFEWQSPDIVLGGADSWATLCSSVIIDDSTTWVSVRFFGSDPDQPVICGVLRRGPAEQALTALRRPALVKPDGNHLRLLPGERLDLNIPKTLTLRTATSVLKMTPRGLALFSLSDA